MSNEEGFDVMSAVSPQTKETMAAKIGDLLSTGDIDEVSQLAKRLEDVGVPTQIIQEVATEAIISADTTNVVPLTGLREGDI